LAGLRDLARNYPEVRFYGISLDPPERSRELAAKIAADHRGALGVSLLWDPRSVVIDRYGLRDPAYKGDKLDGVPRPAVFVLDQQGRIRWMTIEEDYRERPTNEEIAAALDRFE
jgi:peroxiredoxin